MSMGRQALSVCEGTVYLGLGFVPRSRLGFPEPGVEREEALYCFFLEGQDGNFLLTP